MLRRVSRTGPSGKLPTRIVVRVHGLEWFLYNRTSAYDDIISRMQAQQKGEDGGEKGDDGSGTDRAGLARPGTRTGSSDLSGSGTCFSALSLGIFH